MPYAFKNKNGEYIERDLSVDEVMDLPTDPSGKSYIVIDGQRWYRSMSGGALGYGNTSIETDFNVYPKISHSLPGFSEGCDHTTDGACIIENKTQERELLRRHGFVHHREFSDADYRRKAPPKQFIPVERPKQNMAALRAEFNEVCARHKIKPK